MMVEYFKRIEAQPPANLYSASCVIEYIITGTVLFLLGQKARHSGLEKDPRKRSKRLGWIIIAKRKHKRQKDYNSEAGC
jgi:hypothetical protein